VVRKPTLLRTSGAGDDTPGRRHGDAFVQ